MFLTLSRTKKQSTLKLHNSNLSEAIKSHYLTISSNNIWTINFLGKV